MAGSSQLEEDSCSPKTTKSLCLVILSVTVRTSRPQARKHTVLAPSANVLFTNRKQAGPVNMRLALSTTDLERLNVFANVTSQ